MRDAREGSDGARRARLDDDDDDDGCCDARVMMLMHSLSPTRTVYMTMSASQTVLYSSRMFLSQSALNR